MPTGGKMQLGNSIKLDNNVNPEEDTFLVNSIRKYIHAVSVMAKRVKEKRRFIVKLEWVEDESSIS